jgi:hypothetical protein
MINLEKEKDGEKDRYFRYMVRKYESLGPMRLKLAVERVKRRFIEHSLIDETSFWELYEDLVHHNGWTPAAVLAYFDTYNIEERI